MTKDSFHKLESLVDAAPEPSEPPIGEEITQKEGDNPDTLIQGLTVGELAEMQSVRGQVLANQATSDEIGRQRHLDELRDEYIPKLFYLMLGWLAFVAFVVIATGFIFLTLSDAVLIALITTTTATVLGIFVIVAKWLFPSPKEK